MTNTATATLTFNAETVRNIATTAAFIMEGMTDTFYETAHRVYRHGGAIEMVQEATAYAIDCERMFQAALAEGKEVTGVLDYEVANPFGRWFVQRILELEGATPSRDECLSCIETLTRDFFA